jgi:hypothetical protein
MTDTLSTRPKTEAVTALMQASDHPIRRSAAERDDAAEPNPAGQSFPEPPERGSLDDDDLVPLVDRHTSDTATIDLIGILQAQMHLRAQEAARFAAWEEQMRLIGTDEALGELERTRLHFTGVIPIQASPTIVTAGAAPEATALVPERITRPEAPVVTVASVPDAVENAHLQRARQADERLLELDDTVPSAVRLTRVRAEANASSVTRILVVALTSLAAVIAVSAVVLTSAGVRATFTATLGAVGVLAAAWIGVVAARLLLRARRGATVRPETTLSAWALVGGIVVATAVGEGFVVSSDPTFGWQGYLAPLLEIQGIPAFLSLIAGLLSSLVIAFLAVVLVGRSRSAKAESSAPAA